MHVHAYLANPRAHHAPHTHSRAHTHTYTHARTHTSTPSTGVLLSLPLFFLLPTSKPPHWAIQPLLGLTALLTSSVWLYLVAREAVILLNSFGLVLGIDTGTYVCTCITKWAIHFSMGHCQPALRWVFLTYVRKIQSLIYACFP